MWGGRAKSEEVERQQTEEAAKEDRTAISIQKPRTKKPWTRWAQQQAAKKSRKTTANLPLGMTEVATTAFDRERFYKYLLCFPSRGLFRPTHDSSRHDGSSRAAALGLNTHKQHWLKGTKK